MSLDTISRKAKVGLQWCIGLRLPLYPEVIFMPKVELVYKWLLPGNFEARIPNLTSSQCVDRIYTCKYVHSA